MARIDGYLSPAFEGRPVYTLSAPTEAALQQALIQAEQNAPATVVIPPGFVIGCSGDGLRIGDWTRVIATGARIHIASDTSLWGGWNCLVLPRNLGATAYNGTHDVEIIGGTWEAGQATPGVAYGSVFGTYHCRDWRFIGTNIAADNRGHGIEFNSSERCLVTNSVLTGGTVAPASEIIQADFAGNNGGWPHGDPGSYDGTMTRNIRVADSIIGPGMVGAGSHNDYQSMPGGSGHLERFHESIAFERCRFQGLVEKAVSGQAWSDAQFIDCVFDCPNVTGTAVVHIWYPRTQQALHYARTGPVVRTGTGQSICVVNHNIQVEITTAGVIGTAAAKVSLDGGVTWSADNSFAIPSANTPALIPGTAVRAAWVAGSYALGAVYGVDFIAPIAPLLIGTGPAPFRLTNYHDPVQLVPSGSSHAIEYRIRITTGGALGAARAQVSLNGGVTYSSADTFTPATAMALPGGGRCSFNAAGGAAGFVVGDVYSFWSDLSLDRPMKGPKFERCDFGITSTTQAFNQLAASGRAITVDASNGSIPFGTCRPIRRMIGGRVVDCEIESPSRYGVELLGVSGFHVRGVHARGDCSRANAVIIMSGKDSSIGGVTSATATAPGSLGGVNVHSEAGSCLVFGVEGALGGGTGGTVTFYLNNETIP